MVKEVCYSLHLFIVTIVDETIVTLWTYLSLQENDSSE